MAASTLYMLQGLTVGALTLVAFVFRDNDRTLVVLGLVHIDDTTKIY